MPRTPVSIQQVYIADGFADDCDELIHRCSSVDILNYQTFCIYYKQMNFASVFQGRKSNVEIAELSEELLQIAKHYMVLDTSNFEESVAGLFLVYALLNLQPYPRFAALRLVPDDLPALARIERVARRDRRHDVLYILGSVLARGPTQCHAASRPRGMESSLRKYLEGFCNIDITGVRPKGVYFRQNEELDILRDMTGIFQRYAQAKGKITGLQKRALSYSNDNLAVELGASLKRVINGIVEVEGEKSMDHHNTVQEIKKRAMCNVVSTMRHLDSADDRKISPEKSKVAPPQAQAVISEKRRSKKPVESPKKKQKRKITSSTSEEQFEDWSIENYGNSEEKDKNEQEIHVEIDSLPPLITTESDGKLVEIEIIDEMKKKSPPRRAQPIEIFTEKNKNRHVLTIENGNLVEIEICGEIKNLNDPCPSPRSKELVEIEMCDETKKSDFSPTESDGKLEIEVIQQKKQEDKPKKRGRQKKASDEAIFKRPLRMSPRLKPVLKRDQKKPLLKSKFKKMGMLEVANFKETK